MISNDNYQSNVEINAQNIANGNDLIDNSQIQENFFLDNTQDETNNLIPMENTPVQQKNQRIYNRKRNPNAWKKKYKQKFKTIWSSVQKYNGKTNACHP